MKKRILIVVSLLAVLAVGFYAMAETPAVESVEYMDGVYTGRGEGYNDYIEVEVVVEDGMITEINVLYIEDTPGVWDLAVDRLTATMLEEQNVEIDTVSQATYTSEGFIEAVQNALKEAVEAVEE